LEAAWTKQRQVWSVAVLIYCATSVCQGVEVDHIFEAENEAAAIKFIKANGWELLREELATDITFEPLPEKIH